MKIRICTVFYASEDLHRLTAVLMGIIEKHKLPHSINSAGVLDWFSHGDYKFYYEPRHTTRIKDGRNSLITDVFDGSKDQQPLDFDVFWMLDTDMDFTLENILTNLRHDVDIVGSPYPDATGESTVCTTDESGAMTGRYPIDEKGFKEVGSVPGGFMFVKKRVFVEIGYPYFVEPLVEWNDGKNCQEIGEDMGLCYKAKKAKYEVYCDFDNPVQHNKVPVSFTKNEKAIALLKRLGNDIKQHEIEVGKIQAQIMAVSELMNYNASKTNEIVGSNIFVGVE